MPQFVTYRLTLRCTSTGMQICEECVASPGQACVVCVRALCRIRVRSSVTNHIRTRSGFLPPPNDITSWPAISLADDITTRVAGDIAVPCGQ